MPQTGPSCIRTIQLSACRSVHIIMSFHEPLHACMYEFNEYLLGGLVFEPREANGRNQFVLNRSMDLREAGAERIKKQRRKTETLYRTAAPIFFLTCRSKHGQNSSSQPSKLQHFTMQEFERRHTDSNRNREDSSFFPSDNKHDQSHEDQDETNTA
mmetsp:Transcript_34832/g.68767  ORF Transcript_34832/g.68767 Transcript_34832/m.68767 type:complete len:156 (+) Transcript_34832:590-1057(+)